MHGAVANDQEHVSPDRRVARRNVVRERKLQFQPCRSAAVALSEDAHRNVVASTCRQQAELTTAARKAHQQRRREDASSPRGLGGTIESSLTPTHSMT